jgi:hypothetical protein
MSKYAEVNNREKTLGENVLIIALIAVLMSSFLYYFFKQERQLTEVGFDAVARNFSASVLAIRALWFMDGQPDEIVLKETGKPSVTLKVNQQGWLDFDGKKEKCHKIWLALMTTELFFMNQPIAVLEIQTKMNDSDSIQNKSVTTCRYSLPSGESFDYNLSNGKVSVTSRR